MKKDDHVKVTKVSENDGLQKGHTVTGFLIQDVKVGGPIQVFRYEKNGERVPGIFTSSPVVSTSNGKVSTANSVYQVEVLPKPENMRAMLGA